MFKRAALATLLLSVLACQAKPKVEIACPEETVRKEKMVKVRRVVQSYTFWCEKPDGTRHGPIVKTHSNGQIAYRSQYENGKSVGLYTAFYDNGNKMLEGQYREDKMDGDWNHFRRDGSLLRTDVYQNGVLLPR